MSNGQKLWLKIKRHSINFIMHYKCDTCLYDLCALWSMSNQRKGPKGNTARSLLTTFSRLLTVLFFFTHFWKRTQNSHGIIKDLKLILVEETLSFLLPMHTGGAGLYAACLSKLRWACNSEWRRIPSTMFAGPATNTRRWSEYWSSFFKSLGCRTFWQHLL